LLHVRDGHLRSEAGLKGALGLRPSPHPIDESYLYRVSSDSELVGKSYDLAIENCAFVDDFAAYVTSS
jgi:hypothetical protein